MGMSDQQVRFLCLTSFEFVYVVMHGGGPIPMASRATMVVQTVLVMHLLSSLVLHALGRVRNSCLAR